ncbi:nodulation protein NfeD [Verrucomicrobiota bacterium]
MKRYIYFLIIVCFLCPLLTIPCHAGEKEDKEGSVFIIPIDGPIERGLLYVVRRGLAQAEKEDAAVIIFHMNTPGGMVGVTEEIIRMLLDLPENIKTYTFIDKDALSAGALISVATEEIYMAPGSRIGASAIITLFGDLKEGDTKEKIFSAVTALVKSAAERRGHDIKLVEAMIRKEIEYKIGDEVICPEGELLTLTDKEAARLVGKGRKKRSLLSSGTVKTLDELLRKIDKSDSKRITLEVTWSEKIARWIELFSILFLAGGLLGVYIEIKTPGFGIPGILGIICLTIFFWGHNVAGLAGTEELILFLLGVTLLIIEIFIIPGFGIAGVSGIILIMAALVMALVQHYPGTPVYHIPGTQIQTAIVTMSSTVIGSFILMLILARFLPETPAFKRIALLASLTAKEGYQSSEKTDDLLGRKGTADTPLHPAGIGVFGDKRLDVVARGAFIEKDASIVIAEAHGNRIVVESDTTTEENS